MGLNRFFKRRERADIPPEPEDGNDYWKAIEALCRRLIVRTVSDFVERDLPRIQWAKPIYEELIAAPALDMLMQVAKNAYLDADNAGVQAPSKVGRFGSWYVTVTVFRSSSDSDFLRACGGQCENYLRDCRKQFSQTSPDKANLNYAQWILLLNESNKTASVHLFTAFSIKHVVRWFNEREDNKVIIAAAIMPVDLLKHHLYDFFQSVIDQDIEAYFERDNLQ